MNIYVYIKTVGIHDPTISMVSIALVTEGAIDVLSTGRIITVNN